MTAIGSYDVTALMPRQHSHGNASGPLNTSTTRGPLSVRDAHVNTSIRNDSTMSSEIYQTELKLCAPKSNSFSFTIYMFDVIGYYRAEIEIRYVSLSHACDASHYFSITLRSAAL